MKVRILALMIAFLLPVACSGPVAAPAVNEKTPGIPLLEAEILQAEDSRNSDTLLKIAASLNFDRSETAARLAIASGRVGSFKVWETLALQFGREKVVSNSLAVAARFPETGFPAQQVAATLAGFPASRDVIITLLSLDIPAAFNHALSLKKFHKTAAANLWRSPKQVTPSILKDFYLKYPAETVYSIFRTRTAGIVLADDLKNRDLATRHFGCYVCHRPETFLTDPAWQVRVAALRACSTLTAGNRLINDPNPHVRLTALEILAKKHGRIPQDILHNLIPAMGEVIAAHVSDPSIIRTIFDRNGIFKNLAAPFMPESYKETILSDPHVNDRAKIQFTKNRIGQENALRLAEEFFLQKQSPYALQFLLSQKKGVNRNLIVSKAKEIKKFASILEDFGYPATRPPLKPVADYARALSLLNRYRGFILHTSAGSVTCDFFRSQAPLTCANFITLAKKGYFNQVSFHRVVPAFVAQTGDPTATGSGGPGYAIRCEYNALDYDRKGRVGMALSGKDTGGSQFFLTHLATPHLNQRYTVFAQVTSGANVLDTLCQHDEIISAELIRTK